VISKEKISEALLN